MKILMTLMGLEIGGAETHVVELAKELKRRGNDIVIASNGGVFVEELSQAGISHVQLPLHSKKIGNVIKSYNGLKKLISTGNFDLVHAHARIPAFVCGLLHNKLKFRFITTTHWVFKTGILLNFMTNWGERTIAVSNDIKKYLIDNYKVPHKNITVTINGIDTNKFSSQTSPGNVMQEFNMGNNKTRIVYVSRMDIDRSAVAFDLLEITPDLYEKYDNLEVVIVGGGNDYDRLLHKASEVNRKLGKNVVITTGSRTDINRFVATSDIFIGVSRAALEAMAAEKPVIIAGNEGYIGTFNHDKLNKSIQTNFCCRGCGMPTTEKLFKDVCEILDLTDENRTKMGQYNRQIITSRYSVNKMADDCESAYEDLLSFDDFKPYDVLISGYYGYNNIGDDSLLEAMIINLIKVKRDINITVLSATPKHTSKIFNVNSINRFDFFRIFARMKKTKLLISGGGSLVQDVTSTKSLYYYTAIISLALKCKMKVMVYANGIGPVNNNKNRILCKNVLNEVDLITLRDQDSFDEINSLGIDKPKKIITADPAFSLKPSGVNRVHKIFNIEKIDKSKKYFAVSVREWPSLTNEFNNIVVKLCEYIYHKYNLIPLFIPMQRSSDLKRTLKITSKLKCPYSVLSNDYNANDLLGIISHCELVIGMRLHILIYAATANKPVIGLAYDPKIKSMLLYLKQEFVYDVNKLNLNEIKLSVDEIILNQAEIKQSLEDILHEMRIKTKEDAQLAISLLKGK